MERSDRGSLPLTFFFFYSVTAKERSDRGSLPLTLIMSLRAPKGARQSAFDFFFVFYSVTAKERSDRGSLPFQLKYQIIRLHCFKSDCHDPLPNILPEDPPTLDGKGSRSDRDSINSGEGA